MKINDAKYGAIKEYATNYDTLTDAKALELTKQIIGVDQSVAQLRMKYTPMFANVVSGKKTALFFQLDRRLVMLIDLQIRVGYSYGSALEAVYQERDRGGIGRDGGVRTCGPPSRRSRPNGVRG